MILVNLRDLRDLYRIVAVMTDRMVRVRDADIRIRTIALLPRELECDHACDIRLKGQDLQVEHELRMVAERRGNTYRPIQIGRLVVRYRFLASLDLALHLAYAVDVLIQTRAIRSAHPPLDPGDVRG